MKPKDVADALEMMGRLHAKLTGDLKTESSKKNRGQIAREIERTASVYRALRHERDQYLKRISKGRPVPDVKVGECPCGQPIMISSRYAVNMKSPTTINRKCQGHRCGRINAVVVGVTLTVQRATWNILDCRCGSAIHLRSDYAGGPRFKGYDTKGLTQWDLMTDRGEHQKNRTVKIDCPRCDCKYTLVIRFTKGEDDMVTRSLADTSKVQRCAGCKHRTPAESESA